MALNAGTKVISFLGGFPVSKVCNYPIEIPMYLKNTLRKLVKTQVQ